MAEPSNLGIEVQEESGRGQSIARVPTARTAFVGRTLRGPINTPIAVANFGEFQQIFGGLWQPSTLGYAVEQFFDNGGRDAVIVRVVNSARPATLDLPAGNRVLRLRAVRPGTREFLRASVDYDNISDDDLNSFNLTVQRIRLPGTEYVEDQEIFLRVSLAPGAERSLADALTQSELVRLADAAPGARPDRTIDPASGLAIRYVLSNPDGDDGGPLCDYDVIGAATEHTGLFALDTVDNVSLLCIPPLSREQDLGPSALLVAARYAKLRRALLIVDPPRAWQSTQDAEAALRHWDLAVENAVMYFPRLLALDKLRGRIEEFAPCGAVAGMLARHDEVWPVWSAAEGDGVILRPGFRPACMVSDEQRLRLATLGVNTLQALRSASPMPLSPRTLAAGSAQASDWKYLSAKRLALFILNSIERGTRWVVFEPPRPDSAARIVEQVTEFLDSINDGGAFLGRLPEDAFFVICDGRINPNPALASREFNILVGFAALRAGEFHSYMITHTLAGSRVQSASLNRMQSAHYHPAGEEG